MTALDVLVIGAGGAGLRVRRGQEPRRRIEGLLGRLDVHEQIRSALIAQLPVLLDRLVYYPLELEPFIPVLRIEAARARPIP